MSDEVWLRVGEVARLSGLTVRTLHHYDQRGLLQPSGRTSGDYRLYSTEDLDRLLAIQHLKSLGLSLDEVGAALDSPAFDAVDALDRHIATVTERLRAEQDLLQRLRRLRDAAATGWEEVLGVIALTERLRHPEPAVRFRAALDAADAPMAELLDGLTADPEPGVREALTWALANHGSAATRAVADRLADPDPAVRRQMAHVLSKLGDPDAVGPLATALADPHPAVAAKAAQGLGTLGSRGAAGALAPLVAQLPTVADEVAEEVVAALAKHGSAATPLLLPLLSDPSPTVRARAAEALGLTGDEAAVDGLAEALRDDDPGVRFEALVALGHLPVDATEAAVHEALTSPDDRLRLLAQRLFSRPRPDDAPSR